jgi:hypothetical protein
VGGLTATVVPRESITENGLVIASSIFWVSSPDPAIYSGLLDQESSGSSNARQAKSVKSLPLASTGHRTAVTDIYICIFVDLRLSGYILYNISVSCLAQGVISGSVFESFSMSPVPADQ